MKQLLIANKIKAAGSMTYDGLDSGEIAFFNLTAPNTSVATGLKGSKFGIVVGGNTINGRKQTPFVIPEVTEDVTVVKADYAAATNFSQVLTIKSSPAPTAGDVYKFLLVKHTVVPHERNTWYVEYVARPKDISSTAATSAANIASKIKDLLSAMTSLEIGVSVSTAAITFTASEGWTIKDVSDNITAATPTTFNRGSGTADYVKNLARECAGDRGYFYTHPEGHDFIPGYDAMINSIDGTYDIYTLRFAVPRNSAKTRDEVVNQIVHIAVKTTTSGLSSAVNTILSAPVAQSNG